MADWRLCRIGLALAAALACGPAGPAPRPPEGVPLVEAIREAEIDVRMRPDDPARRQRAARLRLAAGSTGRAATHLEAAVRSAPERVDLWLELAEVERLRGDRDAAYVAARRARALAPDDPQVLAVFVRAAEAAGLPDEARRARWHLEGLAPPAASED